MIVYELLDQNPQYTVSINYASYDSGGSLITTFNVPGIAVGPYFPYQILPLEAIAKHNAMVTRSNFSQYPGVCVPGDLVMLWPVPHTHEECSSVIHAVRDNLEVVMDGELFGGITLTYDNKACLTCAPQGRSSTSLCIRLGPGGAAYNDLSKGFMCGDIGHVGLSELGYNISIRQAIDAVYFGLGSVGLTIELGDIGSINPEIETYHNIISSRQWIEEGTWG